MALRSGEKVPTLEIKNGGASIVFDHMTNDNQMLFQTIQGKSYPIVEPAIDFTVNKRLRPGKYKAYLLTEYGATASLSYLGINPTTPGALGPATITDAPCFELKSSPQLTNRIIASNIFASAIGLTGNRRTIIISLLVGLLLGAILATWFILLFVH